MISVTIPASTAKITAVKVGSKISVTIDGKFFTTCIFSEDEKYPFFYPVNGPVTGGSVTSMRNAVYPHHFPNPVALQSPHTPSGKHNRT